MFSPLGGVGGWTEGFLKQSLWSTLMTKAPLERSDREASWFPQKEHWQFTWQLTAFVSESQLWKPAFQDKRLQSQSLDQNGGWCVRENRPY